MNGEGSPKHCLVFANPAVHGNDSTYRRAWAFKPRAFGAPAPATHRLAPGRPRLQGLHLTPSSKPLPSRDKASCGVCPPKGPKGSLLGTQGPLPFLGGVGEEGAGPFWGFLLAPFCCQAHRETLRVTGVGSPHPGPLAVCRVLEGEGCS